MPDTNRRARRALSLVGLVMALVLVSGCDEHPGRAAVVDGKSISDDSVTKVVDAICGSATAARKQTGGATPAVSVPYIRRVVLTFLINFRLADDYLTAHGLSVTNAAVDRIGAVPTQPGLSSELQRRYRGFVQAYQRYAMQLSTIGAHLKNPRVKELSNYDSTTQGAGRAELRKWAAGRHIVVNPTYGAYKNLTVAARSGSLSAAQSKQALTWEKLSAANSVLQPGRGTPFGLPASQICG